MVMLGRFAKNPIPPCWCKKSCTNLYLKYIPLFTGILFNISTESLQISSINLGSSGFFPYTDSAAVNVGWSVASYANLEEQKTMGDQGVTPPQKNNTCPPEGAPF